MRPKRLFILAYVLSLSFPIMSRFQMPTEPKNGLDLLRWVIFEPILLQRFEKTLSRKETLRWFLKASPYIILLLLASYLLTFIGMVVFEFFPPFQPIYTIKLVAQMAIERCFRLFSRTINFFLLHGLVGGLIFGLVGEFVGRLRVGLVGWLIFGFGGIFLIEFSDGYIIEFVAWFLIGLGSGLMFGFHVGFRVELVLGLIIGFDGWLIFGLGGEFGRGFVIGLGFFIGYFFIIYFRLPFYLFHVVFSLFAHEFTRNPYLNDGTMRLPLVPLDGQLVQSAYQEPDIAAEFAGFLFEFRPLQQKLAVEILHAANAGYWAQQAVELDADVFEVLSFPEELKKFNPSETWNTSLELLRTQLINSQTQTQITLKKEAFEQFFEMLKAFRSQTLLESRTWNHFYLDAIDEWLKVSAEHLDTLKQQAQLLEPIASNLYKSGEALQAQFDDRIFVGRDDLKDSLSFEILTARQMPLFLIQGQRRVGKTSLLNFLPLLLGPRFKIVPYDLQGLEDRTLGGFFFALRNTINKAFSIREEIAWNPPEEWLRAWGEFRDYVAQLVNGKDFKLVLAFDEYEILHDDIFQRDPQQAARLLGAMRSFSQQQNQVVFLFVGARFFSELQQPNWNEYFVQVKHLRVDYLKRPDVLHLIQHPTPDFGLIYADDLANRIFDLTQGHPALVQQICSEMVNLANMTNHRQMTHEDLDKVLTEKTLFRENLTIQIFWTQFCSPAERATVKQILAGETPTDPVSRSRLELHGYIVKAGDAYTMRVPLFEQWLRKYIETFPI